MKVTNPRINAKNIVAEISTSIAAHKAAVAAHNEEAAKEQEAFVAYALDKASKNGGRVRAIAGHDGAPTVRNRVYGHSEEAEAAVFALTHQVPDGDGSVEVHQQGFDRLPTWVNLPTELPVTDSGYSIDLG